MAKVCSKVSRGERPKPTSKFLGVSWRKKSNAWGACISVDSRQINLGLHDSEEAAAAAYNRAALKYKKSTFNLLPL
jgi:hypothetical protein